MIFNLLFGNKIFIDDKYYHRKKIIFSFAKKYKQSKIENDFL